jgi:hypothetical protein
LCVPVAVEEGALCNTEPVGQQMVQSIGWELGGGGGAKEGGLERREEEGGGRPDGHTHTHTQEGGVS